MPPNSISIQRQVEEKEYIVINGRRSRLRYYKGYPCTTWRYPEGARSTRVHQIILELKLGRRLLPGEHTHHIDGDRTNYSPDNLEVRLGSEHNSFHARLRNLKHDPDNFVCADCGSSERPHKARGVCANCWSVARRKRTKVTNPCGLCGYQIRSRSVAALDGFCSSCSSDIFDSCVECGRSREQLPQGRHPSTVISGNGLCRACAVRLERNFK